MVDPLDAAFGGMRFLITLGELVTAIGTRPMILASGSPRMLRRFYTYVLSLL